MEFLVSAYQWIIVNKEELLGFMTAVIFCAKFIARLTPSKTDDDIIDKINTLVDKILDMLGVPNFIKKPEGGIVNINKKEEEKKPE